MRSELNPSSGIWRSAALIRLKLLPQMRVMPSSSASRRENEKRMGTKGPAAADEGGCRSFRGPQSGRPYALNGLRKNRISEISST